jgi:succinate dehydrogenase/fumarate reductase flavoprotein subunit
MVAAGRDSDFGRGETPFERASGDPGNRPNPCLGPILCPPFYAIRIHAGSLSSFLGLDTDPRGRVRDAAGRVVRGLYAVGADAESVAGGAYPAAGITLGPAITFGVLAARDMARSRASAMAGAAPPPRATTAAAPVAVT